MSEPVSIAVVDDDAMVSAHLSMMLPGFGVQVAWTAIDAAEARRKLRESEKTPDVMAIDVHMPQVDGHELTRRLLDEFDPLTVVMLTSLDEPSSISAALAAGAVGYLVKTDPLETIALGLRAAAGGLHPFSATASAALNVATTSVPPNLASPLTQREHEVLELMSQSLTNLQIARRLGIHEETVKNHVSAILRKLDVPDRMGAVMWGIRGGVIH